MEKTEATTNIVEVASSPDVSKHVIDDISKSVNKFYSKQLCKKMAIGFAACALSGAATFLVIEIKKKMDAKKEEVKIEDCDVSDESESCDNVG